MDEPMKALKLDATYRPVEVIDALEALVLCIVGKAKAIENYTKEMIANEILKHIPTAKIKYVKKNEVPRDYRVNCEKIKKELTKLYNIKNEKYVRKERKDLLAKQYKRD